MYSLRARSLRSLLGALLRGTALGATALSATASLCGSGAFVAGLGACQSDTICDCVPAAMFIGVDPLVATHVVRAEVQGATCNLLCFDDSFLPLDAGAPSTCLNYTITRAEPGGCELAVTFDDGSMYSRSLPFVKKGKPSCCEGIYPEGESRLVLPYVKPADAGPD